MKTNQIKKAYLDFFTHKIRHHQSIPSAPLIPPDDPTTLFTSSGMQQLVPYLKGQPHPMGKRLVNSQPCFRAEDIEKIGDNRHTTYFEMLGNWSLGDYFKKQQLIWFFDFLTNILNLDQNRLYVTVFAGDQLVKKDKQSIKIWQDLFKTKTPAQNGLKGFDTQTKIYLYGSTKNWWSRAGNPDNMPAGEIGGPDSEVFFDFDPQNKLQLHQKSDFKHQTCHLNCDCGRFLEIGNSVFIEFEKQSDGSFTPLPNKNVDFGGGLERLTAAVNNQPDIFQIDIFKPLIQSIELATGQKYETQHKAPMRVIADHLRGAEAMIKQGIEPSNKLHGYTLRRLIRRSAVKFRQLTGQLTADSFKNMTQNPVILNEVFKFQQSLNKGLQQIDKTDPSKINARFAFDLFQTHGFPLEITQEILAEKNIYLDNQKLKNLKRKHAQKSKQAAAGMFKGGLEDQSNTTTKLHTATHLLHQALRKVLGSHVQQVGSHITAKRLRFDFSHPDSLSEDQIKKIQDLINKQIKKNLPVTKTTQVKEKALKSGALAFFKTKYPDKVTVYSIGDFSRELCGGPHVSSTGDIGGVKIIKTTSVGAGQRRIYAMLKNGNQKSS